MSNIPIDVNSTYKTELAFNQPIDYRGIKVYPVPVSRMFDFYAVIDILTYDPIHYPDAEIATLPRLNFFIEMGKRAQQAEPIDGNKITQEGLLWLKFQLVLAMTLRTNEITFYDPEHPKRAVLNVNTEAEPVALNYKQFEELRIIILEQNAVQYSDEFVHQSVLERQAQDLMVANRSRQSPPDLEDLIDIAMLDLHKTEEEIMTMTIRKFKRLIARIELREQFRICKGGEMSGIVSFKEEIPSWTAGLNLGRTEMEDMSGAIEQYKQKLQSI